MAKKRGRRAGGRKSLRGITTEQLHRELEKRRSMLGDLARERDELAARLEMIDRELSSLGGAPARDGARGRGKRRGPKPGRRGGRRRPRNEGNLVEALSGVLKGKTMSVTEAAAAVVEAGYRTSSKNFRTIVNQALIKGPFKKIDRGQYTARD